MISFRTSARAEALPVSITQDDRLVLEAHVWAVADAMAGLEHDVTQVPDVPKPQELQTFEELSPAEEPTHFWNNFDGKPVARIPPEDWPPPPPVAPMVQQWMRYRPVATYPSDPWIDAARAVILLDTFQ